MKVRMPDGSIEEFSDDTPTEFIKEKANRMKAMSKASLKIRMPNGEVTEFQDNEAGREQAKSLAQSMLQQTAEVEQQEVQEEALESPKGAVMRNLEQGATLGLSDEIAGAAGATRGAFKKGVNIVAGALGKEGDLLEVSPEDSYEGARDRERALLQQDRRQSPVTSTLAEIAGSVASGGVALKGAQSLKNLVTTGSTIGATQGLGYTEEEDIAGIAKDVATGAAIGGVIPGTMGGIGLVSKKVLKGAKTSVKGREIQPFIEKTKAKLKASTQKYDNAQSALTNKQKYLESLAKDSPIYKKTEKQILNLSNKVDEEGLIKQGLENAQEIQGLYLSRIEKHQGLFGKLLKKAPDSKVMAAMAAGSLLADSALTGGLGGGLAMLALKGNKLTKPLEGAIGSFGKMRDNQIFKITAGVERVLSKGIKNPIYHDLLQDAGKISPAAMAAMHHQLLTIDPKYREEIKKLTDEEGKTLLFNKKSRSNAKD